MVTTHSTEPERGVQHQTPGRDFVDDFDGSDDYKDHCYGTEETLLVDNQ